MLEVVKSVANHSLPSNNKVAPYPFTQIDSFFASMVRAGAKVRGDFSQIEKHPDLIIELALMHFWLAYLAQNDPNQYSVLLNIDNFVKYLNVNFSNRINDKLLQFFKEFIDHEVRILNLLNKLDTEMVKQKIASLNSPLLKGQTEVSLGDALLNFSRGAVRPEVELVLRPSLKTEDILNIPPHVSTRAYVDVCLMSMGFVDLMGSKEEQIIERKAYLVDVIASSSKTMQEMEYKKLVALTTVIDRYEKEDKFYGAIITYQAGDRELKFENHMAQQGFMGMSHVTRAQKILATPAKIDEAQNKKQFIVEVLDLFTNLLNKFKQELSALLTVINSRNKYDELFNGEYADVEWPPEDYSELTKEDDSQSSDSDKENEPGTIVRHATQEKSTVVLHSNPENPKAAPPPWASDRPLPLLQLRN